METIIDYGIWSCIPIVVLIVGLLITKKMIETMVVALLVGTIMCYKQNFFLSTISLAHETLAGDQYQNLLFLLLGFGALIKLFEKSGALMGFSTIVRKFAKTQRSAMVVTWILSMIIFIDDYLDILATSAAMKTTTDELKIPREHLAYGINSMGACVCVLIPFSSWSAFAVSCIGEFDMGWSDYIRSLPYMLFPIIAIIMCLLVALGIVPKVGRMKEAYKRVEEGGPLWIKEEMGATVVDLEVDEESEPSSPFNFILPVIALVVVMIACKNDIVPGIFAALIVQFIMYIPQKLMNVTDFINNLMAGIGTMVTLAICILLGNMISTCSANMGFTNFIVGVFGSAIPPVLLPCVTFVAIAAVTWAACNFWVLVLLTIPIFIPIAISAGIDPVIVLAAIMSGAAFGSKFCLYSDCVFMTAASTGVNNMTQIKVVAPYVLSSAGLAALAFLVVGFLAV